jgi:hypothetical protein
MSTITENPFQEEIELAKPDRDLIQAYRAVNRSVDDLAYTPDFDQVYEMYRRAGNTGEKHEVFRRLLILRKSGLLPRLFRRVESGSAAPSSEVA